MDNAEIRCVSFDVNKMPHVHLPNAYDRVECTQEARGEQSFKSVQVMEERL